MSLSLAGNLSPLPVSIRVRWPRPSTSRQRVVYSTRLRSSHDTSFDHSVFGTTPCMAPPSRRKLPPFSAVRLSAPSFMGGNLLRLRDDGRGHDQLRGSAAGVGLAVHGVAVVVGGRRVGRGSGRLQVAVL